MQKYIIDGNLTDFVDVPTCREAKKIASDYLRANPDADHLDMVCARSIFADGHLVDRKSFVADTRFVRSDHPRHVRYSFGIRIAKTLTTVEPTELRA